MLTTSRIPRNDELAQRLTSAGRSGLMVFSASKGRQDALESPDLGSGFGDFAYGLVQTLGTKAWEADLNDNGFVEFMELVDYVSEFVDEETEGEQTSWLARREFFGNFPVAKVPGDRTAFAHSTISKEVGNEIPIQPVQLTTSPVPEVNPAWSLDGSRIAYSNAPEVKSALGQGVARRTKPEGHISPASAG